MFAAAAIFAVSAQHGIPGTTRLTVRAAFSDVGSLRPGDDVRIASVRVGQVGDIRLVRGVAIADLNLSSTDKIYRNANATAASVGARSALGLKFVNLNPGTPDAGALRPGQLLGPADTTGAQDVTDLLAVLDKPTRDALGSTIRQTGRGLAGHAKDLHDTVGALPDELPDVGTISRALSSRGGAGTARMLRAVDAFAGRFQGRQQQLAGLVRQLDTTLDAAATDGGAPLSATLRKVPGTLTEARTALRKLNPPLADTGSAMTQLRSGAEALGKATPDVRGVLREGVRPLNKVPPVATKADPAVRDLTGVMRDARPLAPKLTKTVNTAADPVATLRAYSPEIADFFTYVTRALSDGDDSGHWARFFIFPSTELLTGLVPGLKDPTVSRNPYPAPGQAIKDRKTSLLGQNGGK
ncbi:MlaD family protein [Sciscionella sediminilitoris]|uniref:MlaD family protein n=1 Tax=Sciscionella sediminilitoris TaxID=1445613 RepID=UPI001E5C398B|nr:MlaD family protein [Sciscionella sp. SE31]